MKSQHKVKDFLKKYFIITIGCIIYSLGISLFIDSSGLASGGVTGIAITVSAIFPWINTGLLILLINIPLMILGLIFFGWKFSISTLYSTMVSSLLIDLWNTLLLPYLPLTDELLICSVAGGALFGAGLGLIFRMGSTTAGTDILVKILKKRFRHIRTGMISMIIDVVIVVVGTVLIATFSETDSNLIELIFYTMISITVLAFVMDWVLYGGNSAKLIYIITESEHSSRICARIKDDLEITATSTKARGEYSGKDKVMLLCAIKHDSFPKLRDILNDEDPQAFIVVSSVTQIFGEGYLDNSQEEI